MDANDVHSMDQVAAALRDAYPPMVFAYYTGLKQAGFNDQQAIALTASFQAVIINNLLESKDDECGPMTD